jgi:hypothetical protein
LDPEPEDGREARDPVSYLESALLAIVLAAGAYARTVFDFLFRASRFDAELLRGAAPDGPGDPGARGPYLRPLSFLLLNQIFYFYVYPRQERGPTRAVIEAMPGPILRALDRIEAALAEPNLTSILIVVGPLVLLAALHAALASGALRLRGAEVRFETMLAATCYSVGSMLATVALSAVLGASLTERALSGALEGAALAAFLALMVAPFAALWLRCIQRHFALVRSLSGATWPDAIAAVLAATAALALVAASLLALAGMRPSPGGSP